MGTLDHGPCHIYQSKVPKNNTCHDKKMFKMAEEKWMIFKTSSIKPLNYQNRNGGRVTSLSIVPKNAMKNKNSR